jgi:acetyl-CoA carboxylase biotin carboxyl carrier protein
MDVKEIEKHIELMKKHGVAELEVEKGKVKIVLGGGEPRFFNNTQPAAVAQSIVASESESVKYIRSPFVGTFYESASPGSAAFAKAGQKISKGQTLCIIEAMKIMNEIEADRDCVIKEVLVANEQTLEFDQPIFVIE